MSKMGHAMVAPSLNVSADSEPEKSEEIRERSTSQSEVSYQAAFILGTLFIKYSKNSYIRIKHLRTLRLKFSAVHNLSKNLLQPEY